MTIYLAQSNAQAAAGQSVATVARAYRATALNLAVGPSKVPLDTVVFDPGANMPNANTGVADGTATKGRYVAPVTGYYQVNAQVRPNVSSGQIVGCEVWKNGATVTQGGFEDSGGVTTSGPTVSDVLSLQAGDYLELYAYTSVAVALAVSTIDNYLSVVQVAGTNTVAALSPTAQSTAYTAGPGQSVLMTGANTVTLPTTPQAGSLVQVVALTATVVIARGGTTDTFNNAGTTGLTTVTVPAGCNATLQYLGGVWYVIAGFVQGVSPYLQGGLLSPPVITQPARALNTIYTPSVTHPTLVIAVVSLTAPVSSNAQASLVVGGVTQCQALGNTLNAGTAIQVMQTLLGVVPAGANYDITSSVGGTGTVALISVTEVAL